MNSPWGWKRPPQIRLALENELIVDNFAGGGGASMGIEQAIGRPVDIAINHDPEAIAMHKANHPQTEHHCEDVFSVDPVKVCGGRPVGLAWFSPDCKHFSKAKGGKPVSKKIRGLAWVAVRWAATVKPRVIVLENVEEFQYWGPLNADNKPCPIRKGLTFRRFKKELEKCGYQVEHKEMRACDYGAPTIRKRFFLIARCDGQPIVWPEPTHGQDLTPYNTAADCIDWSIPCPSIFTRKRPLAENTLKRIAKGIQRFVLETADPFIVPIAYYNGSVTVHDINEPLRTITASPKGGSHALAMPSFVPHVLTNTSGHSGAPITEPLRTVTTGGHHALVAAFMAQHNTGVVGHPVEKPLSTITGRGTQQQVVAAHLLNHKGSKRSSRDIRNPVPTICASTTHASLVSALMAPYYGSGSGMTGRDMRKPTPTVTSKERLQLITVNIDGESYILTDIGMRMLQPRELYRAQGFPDEYIINPEVRGKPLTKTAQVRMCGNSVPPPFSRALVTANLTEVIGSTRVEVMV